MRGPVLDELKFSLGRRINSVLRNFPHPVKRKVRRFPPLPAPPRPNATFLVLGEPRTFLDALWTAWSWLRFLPESRLLLAIDGVPTAEMQRDFARLFPSPHELIDASSLLPRIDHCSAGLRRYCREHIYGRKLLVELVVNQDGPMFYSDSDILAFTPPHEVIEALRVGRSCYGAEAKPGFDPWLIARATAHGWAHRPDLNSGLFVAPAGALALEKVSALFSDWPPTDVHRYAEQAAVSVLLAEAQATALPLDRYVGDWQGMWIWERDIDYTHLVARHFFGVVRHRLYLTGMPMLARQVACR